jgi:hypothetical protein
VAYPVRREDRRLLEHATVLGGPSQTRERSTLTCSTAHPISIKSSWDGGFDFNKSRSPTLTGISLTDRRSSIVGGHPRIGGFILQL